MVRGVRRGGVCCASGLNWVAFALLIFATASWYWSWGTAIPPPAQIAYSSVTASTGPWIAGQVWSSYPVPCNCANGFCYSWCYVGTSAVRWGAIPAAAACGPQSLVYAKWSGPLGYCSFPNGAKPPIPSFTPNSSTSITGENTFGSVPDGTVFNTPVQATSLQALSIIATITVFFAAIAGCADANTEEGSIEAAGSAVCCSFLAWVFAVAAFGVWSTFPYVQNLQGSNPASVWVPVWINQDQNLMTAIETHGFVYGPGYATMITAFAIIFIAFMIHLVSLRNTPVAFIKRPADDNVTPNPRYAQGGGTSEEVPKV